MGRRIMTSSWFGQILILLSLCLVNPALAQVDQQRGEAYFKEAATICQCDGGRLWGVWLCGPMVFADARTSKNTANQKKHGSVFDEAQSVFTSATIWRSSIRSILRRKIDSSPLI
jgi:hypothetical protein